MKNHLLVAVLNPLPFWILNLILSNSLVGVQSKQCSQAYNQDIYCIDSDLQVFIPKNYASTYCISYLEMQSLSIEN